MKRRIRIAIGTTAALAGLGTVEVLLCVALVSQWQLVRAPGPASPAEALTVVIAAAAAVLGAWLSVSTLAAMVAHLPGRLGDAADRWARAWAPAVSRRVAAVLVGALIGGALAPGTALGDGPTVPAPAGPAIAPGFTATSHQGERGPGFALTLPTLDAPGSPDAPDAPDAEPRSALDPSGRTPTPARTPAPGWTPSRPVQRSQPHAELVTGGRSSQRTAAVVVVHRGDTLWDIARRHLGPDATDAEVASAWPQWHAANHALIGDDPDLLLPGQILRPPTAASLAAQTSGTSR
jgi:hypothetical protein